MSKFILENVIIEKSSKDIKTGINYELDSNLNLICGNNEAGKSSLMNFIKEGFFRTKGIDTGKIYFSVANKKYRTDIKDARATDQRCKIIDENNNSIDYSFIERTINQKYYEQGFTINLDDLMSIQNKDTATLVDIIKDPSGEKLSFYLEKIKSNAKKTLGDNNRLTKEMTIILDKIAKIDNQINELSNKETQYNNALSSIKNITKEIENTCKKEDFLTLAMQENELIKKLSEIQEEYNLLLLNYNDKLYKGNETYLSIIHNAGKYESNFNILEKNTTKLDFLNAKINLNMNRLNTEYALSINETDILNFNLDYSKINTIKQLITEKDSLNNTLIINNSNKASLDEILLKLKHELTPLNDKLETQIDIEELKDIYNCIDEGLRKYNFLLSNISEIKKNAKINAGGIISNKSLLILFASLFVLTIVIAVISFYGKVPAAGIFSILMSILSLLGFTSLKIASYQDKINSHITKDEEEKDNLLNSLKDKIKSYYSEIDNVESSYLPLKLESLKQEIFNKVQNHTNINELISKNKSETNYNNEKLSNIQSKIDETEKEISIINNKIENLINSENIIMNKDIYLDVIEIIKELQEDIKEKNNLLEEIDEFSKENNAILETLNSFVYNNKINISLSEKYEENVGKLKAINEKNSGIKNQLDILNAEIQNLKNKIEKIFNEKYQYNDISISPSFSSIELQLEELTNTKKDLLNRKKEAEFQKRELESFEGLNNLKIEKNILLDEFQKKIAELVKNKMIISLIETAKSNFDKNQPDLNNAQKYLSILTDGKYSKINLDLQEIQNEDGTNIKKWDTLSRGTKEQLYLALRLGYASNYSKDKVTLEPNGRFDLPIIIDDAFVNFDNGRTRNALKCLIEFSKTNQVLFFTCQSEMMKKHFESLNEKINIINL